MRSQPDDLAARAHLVEQLRHALVAAGSPRALCVAYSGGPDSSALLIAAAALAGRDPGLAVRALHVNHQLHDSASRWESHCRREAAALSVPLQVEQVVVVAQGRGMEAEARTARYAAFRAALATDECLLLAHHATDQAETLVDRVLKGAGPSGLRGMAHRRTLGAGFLLRPFLAVDRQILAQAVAGRPVVEDPSNREPRRSRGWQRSLLAPMLDAHRPGWPQALSRSAALIGEETDALSRFADAELARWWASDRAAGAPSAWDRLVDRATERLSVARLLAEPASVGGVLVRRWLARVRAAPAAPGTSDPLARRRLGELLHQLAAPADRQVSMVLSDGVVQRWRGFLCWVPKHRYRIGPAGPMTRGWQPAEPLTVDGLRLSAVRQIARPGDPALLKCGDFAWQLGRRQGGERVRPTGRGGSVALKKLLQEQGVPPWLRWSLPLIRVRGLGPAAPVAGMDDAVVAIPGLMVAAGWTAAAGEPGWRLVLALTAPGDVVGQRPSSVAHSD